MKKNRYTFMINLDNIKTRCRLTKAGENEIKRYIQELKAKRKEILDACPDPYDDTRIPSIKDILSDISWTFDNEFKEYCNNWGVTNDYNSDYPLHLELYKDFEPA